MAIQLRISAKLKVTKMPMKTIFALLSCLCSLVRFMKNNEFLTKQTYKKAYVQDFCNYNFTLILSKSQKLCSHVSTASTAKLFFPMWRCRLICQWTRIQSDANLFSRRLCSAAVNEKMAVPSVVFRAYCRKS